MDQLAQLAIVRSVGDCTAKLRDDPAAQPAQRPIFRLGVAAEELFAADAAEQAIERRDFFQTVFTNRQVRNLYQWFLADAAIGGK